MYCKYCYEERPVGLSRDRSVVICSICGHGLARVGNEDSDRFTLADFDRYVEEHDVQPGELGEAFAAFLNVTTGWDGEARRI